MMHSIRIATGILFISALTPASGAAQKAAPAPKQTVLFVCEHGTVKSLVAKLLFDRYAAEVGLDAVAVSRGTRADTLVPQWMVRSLASDNLAIGSWRPQTVGESDLLGASMVISFDVSPTLTAATQATLTPWDGLPSVSQDYEKGRDAIKAKVHQLVDSLKRARQRR